MQTTHSPSLPTVDIVDIVPIRRVLVSVFDKTGLDRLAKGLKAAGVRVVSTGGTGTALAGHGVAVDDVSALTGFPEVLDGRVKTLHPHVFAGILARSDRPDDLAVLADHGIERFDAVIVNLYAFENAVAKPGCQPAEAIELIDIGGPSLVRAAAKNHAFTAVVTSPEQYDDLLAAIARGGTTLAERRLFAARAFEHTAGYDAAIARWMARHAGLVAQPGAAPGVVRADPAAAWAASHARSMGRLSASSPAPGARSSRKAMETKTRAPGPRASCCKRSMSRRTSALLVMMPTGVRCSRQAWRQPRVRA